MKRYKILCITFAVIALIGLVSYLAGTRNVNLGAFVFPAILAIIFAIFYTQKRKEK